MIEKQMMMIQINQIKYKQSFKNNKNVMRSELVSFSLRFFTFGELYS